MYYSVTMSFWGCFMSITLFRAAILAAAAVSTSGALAQPANADAHQSTFDAALLAGTCFNCHGTEGRSPGAIPSIAGRPEVALRAQLMAFKSDSPPAGTTVMNRLAKGYSDAEIHALAQYFSQQSR